MQCAPLLGFDDDKYMNRICINNRVDAFFNECLYNVNFFLRVLYHGKLLFFF